MLIRRYETSVCVGAKVRAGAIFRCCIKKRNGNEWLHSSNETKMSHAAEEAAGWKVRIELQTSYKQVGHHKRLTMDEKTRYGEEKSACGTLRKCDMTLTTAAWVSDAERPCA